MSEYSDSALPPNVTPRYSEATLLRVQEETYIDLLRATPLDIARSLEKRYIESGRPENIAEILRMKRYALLAARALQETKQSSGAYDIYTGELLALDQGCRIADSLLYASGQIGAFTQGLLANIPETEDMSSEVPRIRQQNDRLDTWGTLLFNSATQSIRDQDINLTPIHETIIYLTNGIDSERAARIKVGYWLVMRHLIEPAELQRSVTNSTVVDTPQETPTQYIPSTQELTEMFPELISKDHSEMHYESIDELKTMLAYRFLAMKAAYTITDDPEVLERQRAGLEVELQEVSDNDAHLMLDTNIRATGNFFYLHGESAAEPQYTNHNDPGRSELRGTFGGFKVDAAPSQKILTAFKADSKAERVADDPLMPHIILNNVILHDFETDTIRTFEGPVDVPLLYKTLCLSAIFDHPNQAQLEP